MELLTTFLNLDDKNHQDLHLQRLIEAQPIKQRRPRKTKEDDCKIKERQAAFTYHAIVGNTRIQVCKSAFVSLHAVTQKRVTRIANLLLRGETPKDKRGFHPNAKKTPVEVEHIIHQHIESFPAKTTHYSGSEIQYLDARLDVKQMHQLFKEKHPNVEVKYKFYLRYFNENFRYRFGRPQIDVCSTCEELRVKIKSPHLAENVKRAAKSELEIHKRQSKKFYIALKETEQSCKDNMHVGGLVFDYMQNLPLPHIPVQEIFYLRQLWVNCFCVHNLKTQKSLLFVYHEGRANKGANEVCSFLHYYINEYLDKSITELHLYSDGCVAQNKNHAVIRMCLGLTHSGRFSNIIHRYPVRGHSFLPCDREFGSFKRKMNKYDRIYTPKEYCSLLVNSKSNVLVHMVETSEILDFNKWWPTLYKKDSIAQETQAKEIPRANKVHFTPMSFREFKYSAEKPGIVVASANINGLVDYTFPLAKPHLNESFSMDLSQAYVTGKVPINTKKMDDIRKVFKYVDVNEEAAAFYREILQWPTTEQAL